MRVSVFVRLGFDTINMFFSVQFFTSWQWEGLKLAHRFSSSKHVALNVLNVI